MILSKPFDNKLVDFQPLTGEISIPNLVSEKICGNYQKVDDFDVAIYCRDGALTLQIGEDCWSLLSSVRFNYFHNLATKKTIFEVIDGENSVIFEYKSWWADIPGFEPVEPEMDADEDFLGYVFYIWSNREVQKSLIAKWS